MRKFNYFYCPTCFQQHRDASCHQVAFFFPARQVAGGNSRHSDRNNMATCNIVCQLQTWMAQFKWGDAPRPGRPKTVIILENIDQIHELIMKDRWADFG